MKNFQIAFQLGAKMDSSVRNAFGKANRQINTTRKKLSNVAKTAAKMSAAVVAAGTAAAGAGVAMANSFANAADEINNQANKAGIGTTALQEYRFAMGQLGVEERDLQQALERTNRRYGQAIQGNEKYREALQNMNVDLYDAQGNIRSTEAVFSDAIQKLNEMDDSQRASALASEFFGQRLSSQLLPALEADSKEIENLRKEAHELGGVIDEEGIKAATEWKGSMDKLKFAFQGVFNTVAVEALPTFQRFLDAGIDKMPEFQNILSGALNTTGDVFGWLGERGNKAYSAIRGAIKDNFPNFKSFGQLASDTGETLANAFKAAEPYIDWFTTTGIPLGIDVLGGIYDKASAFYGFIKDNWPIIGPIVAGITASMVTYRGVLLAQTAVTKAATIAQLGLTAATKGFGAAMAFATSPIGMAVIAIGALVTAGVFLYKNWDTISEKASEVWDTVSGAFGGMKDSVVGALATARDFTIDTWESIASAAKGPINTLIGFQNSVISGYQNIINAAGNAINSLPKFDIPDWVPKIGGGSFAIPAIPEVDLSKFKVPALAEGGIATGPTMAMVGEGPESEVISPISKLRDFINRPDNTTNINDSDQQVNINYNPQINIEGNTSREDIEQALAQDYQRFKRFIEWYFRDKKRLSFVE